MKFRRNTKHELRYHLGDLFVDASCLHHQDQLIVKSALLTVDRWLARHKYPFNFYSSVAQTVHVWRDLHRKVYATWVSLFGPIFANKYGRTLIARCFSGRWDSISATPQRILAPSREQLASVLVYALTHRISLAFFVF